jgi:hypothetical protein
MRNEYQYLAAFALWLLLCQLFPLLAIPVMCILVYRHFSCLRKQRKLSEFTTKLHSERRIRRWAELEGFGVSVEKDSADWWK